MKCRLLNRMCRSSVGSSKSVPNYVRSYTQRKLIPKAGGQLRFIQCITVHKTTLILNNLSPGERIETSRTERGERVEGESEGQSEGEREGRSTRATL